MGYGTAPDQGSPRRPRRGRAAAMTVAVLALLAPVVVPAGLGAAAASTYWSTTDDQLGEPALAQPSTLLASDGSVLATLFLYNRQVVDTDAISPLVRQAIVAVEDQRFFDHAGVDIEGIARAAKSTLTGDRLEGGSTITQQYVKLTLANAGASADDEEAAADATRRSVWRKAREAKLALAVEDKYSKDEILTKYLNIAYFGSGSYGVQAAAQRFFGVDAADLTLPQAALLAGLVQNPAGLDPVEHPEAALARRSTVLARMVAVGAISDAERDLADTDDLGLALTWPDNGCQDGPAPFFCDWVRSQLEADPALGATVEARRTRLLEGGLTITTTLDVNAQAQADAAVKAIVPPSSTVAAAQVLITPGTGDVRAIAISRDYGTGEGQTVLPLATTAAFQPGSTFKAFTLAAALEAGLPLTTTLPGGDRYTSKVFDNPATGYYSNAGDGEGQNLTLQEATTHSVNTAFVQLEERVGLPAVVDAARRAGVTSLDPASVGAREGSLTLGTKETSPMQMATAYATFAAHGKACTPRTVLSIVTSDGTHLSDPEPQCQQAFAPAVADTVAAMLAGVVSDGTGKDAAVDGFEIAGKTGTTQEFGAAWFVGFTPTVVDAVWVGDPRGPSNALVNVLGVKKMYGGTIPARIFHDTMASVLAGTTPLPLPRVDPSYLTTGVAGVVPDVRGLTVDQATARLRAAGLDVSEGPAVAATAGQSTGVIVKQSPAAGSPTGDGLVTVTVSR